MDSWLILVVAVPLLVLVMTELSSAGRRQRETAARLRRVEAKLDVVMGHLGLALPEPALPEVLAQLERGQKIAAVKAYREATGEGLREAKEAVDRLAAERGL
ncbi:ribosomal protein L7/L12 [Plantactinospora veratri]|uniref:Ribosomal protein L7/L12 n=1 Tax=Plantactinospora veratri TaxID=1436122 RepID=A0ABU7SQ47_9ACTN